MAGRPFRALDSKMIGRVRSIPRIHDEARFEEGFRFPKFHPLLFSDLRANLARFHVFPAFRNVHREHGGERCEKVGVHSRFHRRCGVCCGHIGKRCPRFDVSKSFEKEIRERIRRLRARVFGFPFRGRDVRTLVVPELRNGRFRVLLDSRRARLVYLNHALTPCPENLISGKRTERDRLIIDISNISS